MRDINVGDTVYDETGSPSKVTYVSPVYTEHRCFEVEFDTGEVLVADENHKWYVEGCLAFHETEGLFPNKGRIPKNSGYAREGVIRTGTLAKQFKKGRRNIFAIPTTAPLKCSDIELPVDPYFLGLWLSDGHSHSTRITGLENEVSYLLNTLPANYKYKNVNTGPNKHVAEMKVIS